MDCNIECFLTLLAGAIICQLLSLNSQKIQGIKPFLKNFFPGKSKEWYYRVNVIVFPLIGTFLAYVLLSPTDLKSSLLAGITWCGSLQSFGIFLEKE